MREDYQALIDEVCALLGTPATLERRDFALIAFGAHESDSDGAEPSLDPVRRRSILGRRSSAEVRAWFESFGITKAKEPVRIDAEPSAGVEHGRICLPVRHAGSVHGYIWLMDDGALDLADPRLAAAMSVAARIGVLLAAEVQTELHTGQMLRTMLTEDDHSRREEAAAELRELLGPAAAGPLALLAVYPWRAEDEDGPDGPGQDGPAQDAIAAPGGGRDVPVLPHVLARCVVPVPPAGPVTSAAPRPGRQPGPPALAALVRLRSSEVREPALATAARLLRVAHASATGGIGSPRRSLSGAAAAWREALAAARAARAEPQRVGPVAEWDGIGPYRLLTDLSPGAADDPAVQPLLRPVHAELARTAEVFLDHAGQAGRTAAALDIHRQTLYYRLSRIEALTGLDLDEGTSRLLLHMALKAARLPPRAGSSVRDPVREAGGS